MTCLAFALLYAHATSVMKNNGISIIKGLAIIGVVLHHVHNRRFFPETLQCTDFLSFLFSWCVLAFFAVSGWLHALSEQKKKRSLGNFLLSRFNRLLLPFVILVFAYAAGMQLIQATEVISLRDSLPPTFGGKLAAMLWPVDSTRVVAEQLYFLPLLFLISVVAHAFVSLGKIRPVFLLAILSFATGIVLFPRSPNLGFSMGVFVWGLFSYLSGYLMHEFPATKRVLPVIALAAVVTAGLAGPEGLLKMVPLLLLAGLPFLQRIQARATIWVGEAAGTIYIYHTPFLLQPLLILFAARMHSWPLQLAVTLVSVELVIALCGWIYHGLKDTRFSRALL